MPKARNRRKPLLSERRKSSMAQEAFRRMASGKINAAEYDRLLRNIREA